MAYRLGDARRKSLLLVTVLGVFLLISWAKNQGKIGGILDSKRPWRMSESLLNSGIKSLSTGHLNALRNSTLGVRINLSRERQNRLSLISPTVPKGVCSQSSPANRQTRCLQSLGLSHRL